MKHTKKIRILLTLCWILLGAVLLGLIWFATNYMPLLRSPLATILFLYAILTPAMIAGMHFLKRRERDNQTVET